MTEQTLDPPEPHNESLEQERKAQDADRWYDARTERQQGGWQCPLCGLTSMKWWSGQPNPEDAPSCCRGEKMVAYRIPPMTRHSDQDERRMAAQEMLSELERTRENED